MQLYNVRDAFQLLKERGIARDKQEVRKWLNEGLIEATPPVNRRVGWKIEADKLQTFIRRFENGEFEELRNRRRPSTAIHMYGALSPTGTASDVPVVDPLLVRLEDEVITLRQQVRGLRRELNDLKKVLGFPLLASATQDGGPE